MSATYILLNIIILTLVLMLFRVRHSMLRKPFFVAVAGLFVLTAVFDNMMIAIQAFGYSSERILGIHIGLAPIEDFFYPLVAALLVAVLWPRMARRWPRGDSI